MVEVASHVNAASVAPLALNEDDRKILNFAFAAARFTMLHGSHGRFVDGVNRLQEKLNGYTPGTLAAAAEVPLNPEVGELSSVLVDAHGAKALYDVFQALAERAADGAAPRLRCLFTFVPE